MLIEGFELAMVEGQSDGRERAASARPRLGRSLRQSQGNQVEVHGIVKHECGRG